MWFKPEQTGASSETIVSYDDFSIQYSDRFGQLHLGPASGARQFWGIGDISDEAWHHLVVTYDGAGVATSYLDSVSLGTGFIGGDLSFDTSLDAGVRVGGNSGSYDELAFFDRALTPAEIGERFALVTQ